RFSRFWRFSKMAPSFRRAEILKRRAMDLEMAREFGAAAEERRLGDAEEGGRGPGIAGDGGFDLSQQAGLRPLANVGIVAPRPDEVIEQAGDLWPRRGSHGEARGAAGGRGLQLPPVGAVGKPQQVRAAARHPAGQTV